MNIYVLLGVWLVLWIGGWWIAKNKIKAKQPIGMGWLISLPFLIVWMLIAVYFQTEQTLPVEPVSAAVAEPKRLLTDSERNMLSIATGANYNYADDKEGLNLSLQNIEKLENSSQYKIDQQLITEYKKSRMAVEQLALNRDYQAQRNLAFGYATDPKIAGGDSIQGCAWYLTLFNSGSSKVVRNVDLNNIKVYCGDKMLNVHQQKIAAAKATALLKEIYNEDIAINVADYL